MLSGTEVRPRDTETEREGRKQTTRTHTFSKSSEIEPVMMCHARFLLLGSG